MRLRQVALAAHELDPVSEDLCASLGIEVGFRDPGVGVFGLANVVLPVGRDFLEVVSPTRPDASAARLLARRGGDAGYMALFETADLAGDRARLVELGVRVVWEAKLPDIAAVHLHPKDVGGAIVSLDQPRPAGSWRWGGPDWERHVRSERIAGLAGIELVARDPQALAARWAAVLGLDARPVTAGAHEIPLEAGATLRFVAGTGDEALLGVRLRARDWAAVLSAARERGLAIEGESFACGGVRFEPAG